MDIQQQLDHLHNLVEEVRKGKVGPRGPAGDINSAVANATEATRKELADTLAKIDSVSSNLHNLVEETKAELRSVVAEYRTELRRSEDDAKSELQDQINGSHAQFRTFIENEVANIVVKILAEYGVRDVNGDPIQVA